MLKHVRFQINCVALHVMTPASFTEKCTSGTGIAGIAAKKGVCLL
jgi:hypothetical protein